MSLRLFAAAGLVLLALQPLTARAASIEGGADIAVAACAAPELGAAWLVTSAEDGIGGYVVWMVDDRRGVWLCSTDASGTVYANIPMAGDLLTVDVSGTGATYVPAAAAPGPVSADGTPLPRPNPIRLAEAACGLMALGPGEHQLARIGDDGLGAYLAWYVADDGGLWLCDASGSGTVYAYEAIDDRPIEPGV